MTPQPLLLGVTTLFYGLQIDQLTIALLLAIVLEAYPYSKLRWVITPAAYKKLISFCAIAFLLLAMYFLSTKTIRLAFLQLLQWQPLIVLPLVIIQRYTKSDHVNVLEIFLSILQRKKQPNKKVLDINPGYIYFVLCLIASGLESAQTQLYYPSVFVLCAWILWPLMPVFYSRYLWVVLIIVAGAFGFAGHIGLNKFQNFFTDATVDFLSKSSSETDPYQKNTNLGHIGTLKASDRIIMRVKIGEDIRTPIYLHRASYNGYFNGNWLTKNSELQPIVPDAITGSWSFTDNPSTENNKSLIVSTYLENGTGVLSIPIGTYRVNNLPVTELTRNTLGSTRVVGDEGYIEYETLENPDISLTASPTDNDLLVPKNEATILDQIVDDLELRDKQPGETLKIVKAYFVNNFKYSLYNNETISDSALNDFFIHTHAGHCEYFATGTVLLLRAAGIPARYSTGYSVVEYSDREKVHIVRQRHAHAWSRVFVDGVWQDFDTTPSTWVNLEQDNAAFWEPLIDLWSWLQYRLHVWRNNNDQNYRNIIIIFTIPFLVFFFWRFRGKLQRTSNSELKSTKDELEWPGKDSEFYFIEKKLIESSLGRNPEEPVKIWINRITALEPVLSNLPPLDNIIQLHYMYRFKSQGLNANERLSFSEQVMDWLMQYEEAFSKQTI